MTKVTVNPGICGFSVIIKVEKVENNKVHVFLESECEMVMDMCTDISSLKLKAALTDYLSNPVYRSAAEHIKHVACPIPAGILKAIEVEIGGALPRDASIVFEKGHNSTG
jgi:hypothetical protein